MTKQVKHGFWRFHFLDPFLIPRRLFDYHSGFFDKAAYLGDQEYCIYQLQFMKFQEWVTVF